MSSDPILATLHRPVDHEHRTAIGCFDDPIHGLAPAHGRQNLGAVFLRVDIQATGRYPILDEIHQRTAGLHDLGRQTVHFNIAIIANEHLFVRIEQDNALSHIVENHGQQIAVAAAYFRDTPPFAERKCDHCQSGKNGDGVDLPVWVQDVGQDSPTRPIADFIAL
jgi:hypothetical protein